MAFKGTAGKSSTGASMSKYDVEVEGRLKALEGTIGNIEGMINSLVAQVDELKSHSHDAPVPAAGSGCGDVIEKLKQEWPGRFQDL